ncbi:MAG TPA: DNA-processing protein DprA [Terriglobales bacterium]
MGPARIKKLVEHYGAADRVFQASLTELETTGMRAVSAQSIATGKSLEMARQECVKAVEAGAKIISLSDPEYPSRLKEIYDPPVILFVKGNVEVLAQPGIAMVGTRHPTPLRQRHGRTFIHRPGRARPGDHQRPGARRRYRVASRSNRSQGEDGRRPRYRY